MEMYIGAVERISYYIDAENSNGRKENCKFFSFFESQSVYMDGWCNAVFLFHSILLPSVFFSFYRIFIACKESVYARVLYMTEMNRIWEIFYRSENQRY